MRGKHVTEKRLVDRLSGYWERLPSETGSLPNVNSFNRGAVQDVWPFCMRLQVKTNGALTTFLCEDMGEEVKRIYGKNLTKQPLSTLFKDLPGVQIIKQFEDMLPEIGQPMKAGGQFVGTGSKIVKYRSCALPFSSNKIDVTHAIIGLSWQEF